MPSTALSIPLIYPLMKTCHRVNGSIIQTRRKLNQGDEKSGTLSSLSSDAQPVINALIEVRSAAPRLSMSAELIEGRGQAAAFTTRTSKREHGLTIVANWRIDFKSPDNERTRVARLFPGFKYPLRLLSLIHGSTGWVEGLPMQSRSPVRSKRIPSMRRSCQFA